MTRATMVAIGSMTAEARGATGLVSRPFGADVATCPNPRRVATVRPRRPICSVCRRRYGRPKLVLAETHGWCPRCERSVAP